MIIPPGVDFEFIDPNPHVMAAYFHWDFPGNKRKVSGKKLPLPLIMEAPDFTMFDQASRHAVELLNRSSRLDGCHCEEERLAAEYILKSLILEALGAQERQAPKSHYEKTVSKALAVLQEDPKRFRSVEQWARFMGYSTSHFRAICLEVTRERPVDILIKTRIAHAKRLLNHSNLTIKMIAEQLGYEDANYLSRQFYEVTGVTAKEYRRNSAPTARG